MEHIEIAARPALILSEFSLRSRKELPVRDIFNARQYEYWNTDVPGPAQNFPNRGVQAPKQDMNPINTRTVVQDYRQSQPFDVDGPRLGNNIYFQKFDVATDPRNVARELNGAVYEYNPPRDQSTNQKILSRNFESRYIPVLENQPSYNKAVDIYSGMRPVLNNMKTKFR